MAGIRLPAVRIEPDKQVVLRLGIGGPATGNTLHGADSSSATMKVKFPAGTYECLVKEKASDKNHSAFYISLDGIATRVYPRNPPSGKWELTTRVPVYFTLEESRTLTINITPHSDYEIGSTGMDLDYIQFVRR